MEMSNWTKILNGDMSGLKSKVKTETKISDDKIYRIQWANGQKTGLVNHNEAVRKVNEWMNRFGWDWVRVINEDTNKIQVVREPSSKNNRGFLHLKKLDENMLVEKATHKSKSAKKVLQLMDKDYSYSDAGKKVSKEVCCTYENKKYK